MDNTKRERIIWEKNETKTLLSDLRQQKRKFLSSLVIYGGIITFYILLLAFLTISLIRVMYDLDSAIVAIYSIALSISYMIIIKEIRRLAKLFKMDLKIYRMTIKSIARWSQML